MPDVTYRGYIISRREAMQRGAGGGLPHWVNDSRNRGRYRKFNCTTWAVIDPLTNRVVTRRLTLGNAKRAVREDLPLRIEPQPRPEKAPKEVGAVGLPLFDGLD